MIASLLPFAFAWALPTGALSPAQESGAVPIFFRAEPMEDDGLYCVYLDEDPDLVPSFKGIVLARPSETRKLDNYTVGSAVIEVELVEDGYMAYVKVDFREGFEPLEDEELMVQLGVVDPNPHFDGLAFGLAAHGIVLTTLEEEELLSFRDTTDDGAYFDQVAIQAMRDELRLAGRQLREVMGDNPVPSGRFEGGSMFDAMENATLADVRLFLERVLWSPLSYMGETWMLAEIYATWVMQGAPEGGKPETGELEGADGEAAFGTGLRFAEPTEDGFPCIGSLSRAVYGDGADVITLGARILSMDGESLYGADPKAVAKLLAGLAPHGAVHVVIHTRSNAQFEVQLFCLPLPAELQWEAGGGEEFSPKLFPIRREDSWGFIDSTGDEVIAPAFDNTYGHLLGHTFVGGLQGVEVDGKWGFINLAGAMVIPPKWPSVDPFFGGLAAVMDPEETSMLTLGARHGYIDRTGREVIAPKYVPSILAPGFFGDLCAVRVDGKEGFIDRKGKLVIPAKFACVGRFIGGLAAAQAEQAGPYGYIDPLGAWVIAPAFQSAGEFHGGQAVVQVEGEHVAIDLSGEPLFTYALRPFTGFEPLKAVDGRLCGWSEERQRYGYMDEAGKTVIEAQFTKAQAEFHGGLAAVTHEPVVDGEVGGWMFIDRDGEVVIEGPFEATAWFTEGACWVQRDGRWGLIDTSGLWLAEPAIGERPRPLDSGLASLRIHDALEQGSVPQYVYVYLDRSGEIVWSRYDR